MKEWFCFPEVTASFGSRTEVVFFQDWVPTRFMGERDSHGKMAKGPLLLIKATLDLKLTEE